MALQLYVWGPAFGLPSLDAECLAAIAYLAQTTNPAEYELIQSSPSGVPTQHLPALYNPSTSTWTSGYFAITRHLSFHPLPSFHSSSSSSSSTTPTARKAAADSSAYTAFLTAHAAPLLALSLYVSSANYSAATRPAYSAVLPLPLPWTEPPAVRAAQRRAAAHLGMSALDTDADRSSSGGEEREEAGWVAVPSPSSLGIGKGKPRMGMSVQGMLAPEDKARIRLEGLASDVLDVLAPVDWDGQDVAARCLAFGYLALMALPEVPRPWLREVIERRYQALGKFVERFIGDVFAGGIQALPWVQDREGMSVVGVGARFARGVLAEVPWFGEQWCRWWVARKKRQERKGRGLKTGPSGDLLLVSWLGCTLIAMSAGIFFYRGLPPFGAAVQTWRRPAAMLSTLGAAGALFSGTLYGL